MENLQAKLGNISESPVTIEYIIQIYRLPDTQSMQMQVAQYLQSRGYTNKSDEWVIER